nr:hypothetical protein Iba_scaffold8881CG0170 [Ipomoea batatas]
MDDEVPITTLNSKSQRCCLKLDAVVFHGNRWSRGLRRRRRLRKGNSSNPDLTSAAVFEQNLAINPSPSPETNAKGGLEEQRPTPVTKPQRHPPPSTGSSASQRQPDSKTLANTV